MMPAGQALTAMQTLRLLDYADAFGAHTALILAPHPDDESLGCGGLIAEACTRGTPPVIAVLTDGSRSHPHSARYPAGRLCALREQETLAAVAALGLAPDRVEFLRYRDTEAPNVMPGLAEAAARIAAIALARRCTIIVAPWRHDPHCDHEVAAAIAAATCRTTGARLLSYPVWGLTLPPAQVIDAAPVEGFRLDVRKHLARKRAAILAHASQHAGIIEDDPGGFQMTTAFMERFLTGFETYFEGTP